MNVAFIPIRGGSKSIPLKNIKIINGRPLAYWVIKAACQCSYIDKVYVASDSKQIRDIVSGFKLSGELSSPGKLHVIGRSPETASDTASTESAMLEFAEKYEFDNIALIQATSPLLKHTDLEAGFKLFLEERTDSVLSVVRQKRFCWTVDGRGFGRAENYDIYARPRRQEFEGYLVENGAFYITSRICLVNSGNRISGNIRVVEMDENTLLEIDEPADWPIVEALMRKNSPPIAASELPDIKMVLTDCDGCLTDGGMYYSEKGDELKKFNTRDGVGFEMLRGVGVLTGIVTGEDVELNRRRARKLKVDIFEPGCTDKLQTVRNICRQYDIGLRNVLYIGDDINDLPLIRNVGYSCCPSDAVEIIKVSVSYVAVACGGRGVIREVAELLCGSGTAQ